ncbi:hypothetical protein NCCP28_17060 [Niallia sp. NCCP-28]|nr:hypothetical protein NCCP28_17060 [Niallia sp. NCCP-28]
MLIRNISLYMYRILLAQKRLDDCYIFHKIVINFKKIIENLHVLERTEI